MSALRTKCGVTRLGRIEYSEGLSLQQGHLQDWRVGVGVNRVIVLEHPHTITIGRAGTVSDVLADEHTLKERGIEVHTTDRGGEVTYHGPGQLIAYPIVNLRFLANDVLRYVRLLEESVIVFLKRMGIGAERVAGRTGVWVGTDKICAIGVKVTRLPGQSALVTSHGLALNVSTDLRYFSHIVPCGQPDAGVTSLSVATSHPHRMEEVRHNWLQAFSEVFNLNLYDILDNGGMKVDQPTATY